MNTLPPTDVHWVWHCHMLSPHKYAADCALITGGQVIIDHQLPTIEQLRQLLPVSYNAWNDFAPNEPYYVDELKEIALETDLYSQKSSYNIAAAVQRQRSFNYQVSLQNIV